MPRAIGKPSPGPPPLNFVLLEECKLASAMLPNFSKIDSSSLQFLGGDVDTNYQISVYAINYNVLRIMSGMGGLLFSN